MDYASLAAKLGTSAHGLKDSPEQELANKERYQAIRYNKLKFQANQALRRGLIDQSDYDLWLSGERPNFIQRGLGITENRTGGALETFVDVISLGNYLSTALADSATEYAKSGKGVGITADLGFFGPFSIGYNGDAFSKSWSTGQRYQEYFAKHGYDIGFTGGIVADILLDPTTYMTLGVGAGAKIALKGGAKVGAKTIAKEGAELTLSRFGRGIYRAAAKDLQGEFAKEVGEEAAARYFTKGGAALHMMDRELATRWQNRIADHMVANFERLRTQALYEKLGTRPGLMKRISELKDVPGAAGKTMSVLGGAANSVINGIEVASPYIPGTDQFLERVIKPTLAKAASLAGPKNIIENALRYSVEDIFEETATVLAKDRGITNLYGAITSGTASKRLAAAPFIGGVFRSALDTFDRAWDAPVRYVEARRMHQADIANKTKEATNRIWANMAHLTDEERTAVSHYIENRDLWEKTGQGTMGGIVPVTEKMEKAIEFFRKEMDDILAEEEKFGLNIHRIENYVSHIYANPVQRKMILDTARKNLFDHFQSGNKYTQQRLIATLMDVEDKFGKGVVLTDAMEILSRRKFASIQAIEKTKFLTFIRSEFGVAESFLAGLRESASNKNVLHQYLQRTREGGDWFTMHGVDQMWTDARGNLTKLGFKADDMDHNMKLLEYLQTPLEARAGHPLNASVNEEARLHYILQGDTAKKAIPSHISVDFPLTDNLWKGKATTRPTIIRGEVVEKGVSRIESALGQTDKTTEALPVTDLIRALNNPADPLWQVIHTNLEGTLAALNKFTRTNLDASVEAFVPKAREMTRASMYNASQKELAEYMKSVSARVNRLNERLAAGKITQEAFNESMKKIDTAASNINKRWAQDIKEVDKVFDGFAEFEVRKMVGTLPQEIIDAAKASRWRMGDITDTVPPRAEALRNLTERFRELSFTKDQKDELLRLLLGSEKIKSAREVDIVNDFLHTHNKIDTADDFVEVQLKFPIRKGETFLRDMPSEDLPFGEMPGSKPVVGGPIEAEDVAQQAAGMKGNAARQAKAMTGVDEVTRSSLIRTEARGKISPRDPYHSAVVDDLIREEKITPSMKKDYDDWQTLDAIITEREKILKAKGARAAQNLTDDQLAIKAAKKSKMAILAIERKIEGIRAARDELRAQYDSLMKKSKSIEGKKKSPNLDQAGAYKDKADKLLPDIAKREQQLVEQSTRLEAARAASKADVPEGTSLPRGKLTKEERKRMAELKKRYDALLGRRLINDVHANHNIVDKAVKQRVAEAPTAEAADKAVEALKAPRKEVSAIGRLKERGTNATGKMFAEQEIDGVKEVFTPNFEKEYSASVYLPRSIANDLKELYRPAFNPDQSEAVRRLVVGYDKLMQYFKTNLMAPIAGFYMRNFQTNIAMAYLKSGFEIFKGDFLPVLSYAIRKDTGSMSKEALDELGKQIITSRGGREISVAELYEEMSRRGILTGSMQDIQLSAMDNGPMGTTMTALRKAANVASGAAFGAMAGTTVDAAIGQQNGYDLGSILGAVVGGALGAKRLQGTLSAQKGAVNKAAATIQSGFSPFMRAGELTTEIPAKVALFISEFRKTDSLSEAANAVYSHMNDYANISAFERRVLRRAIPFYSWTKLAVESTWHVGTTNPHRLIDSMKAIENWNQTQHGADPEDVPDFLWNKLHIVAGNHVIVSPGTPLEDVADLIQTFMPGQIPGTSAARLGYGDKDQQQLYKGVIGRLAFGPAAGLEFITGVNSYSGENISESVVGTEWKTAPNWLKAMVGYTEESGQPIVNPNLAWVVGEVPWSRMIGIIKNIHDTDDPGKINYRALARSVLGMSVYKRDERTQKLLINRSRLDAMQQLLKNVGQIREYTDFVDFDKSKKKGGKRRRYTSY